MKKIILGLFLILAAPCCVFAANETIEALIGALEEKEPAVIEREVKQRRDVEWAEQEIAAVKKHLRLQTDKIENTSWVISKLNIYSTYIDIYCIEQDGVISLRLVLAPRFDTEPLMMERFVINVDGAPNTFAVPAKNREITSKVRTDSSGINEVEITRWYKERANLAVTKEIKKVLRQAADAKETLIRMRGRYNFDFKMSKATQISFDAMLRYYEARQIILASQN